MDATLMLDKPLCRYFPKMDTIECIKTRRSRRLFIQREVPEVMIRKILECAVSAPSSVDCQPWHFVIVKDKGTKEELAKLKTEDNQRHILTAPVVIVVCADTEKSPSRYIEDGVTATQNILLAAHNLGLGAVYVTGCKATDPSVAGEVRRILSIPDRMMSVTIIPIGYTDPSEKLDKKTLKDLGDIVHLDRW